MAIKSKSGAGSNRLSAKEREARDKSRAELKQKKAEAKTAKPKKGAAAAEKKAKAELKNASPDTLAGKKAEIKATKQELQVAADAVKTKATHDLEGAAKEINVRLQKANEIEGKADDHRLAAAIKLAEAEKLCIAAGMKFKDWAEKNITQSWETSRKLLAVGKAPEPTLALQDLRGRNKEANRKLRERQSKDKGSRDTKPAAFAKATTAESNGKGQPTSMEQIKSMFLLLRPKDKMVFLNFAADAVGAKVTTGL
jgi:hypothetical protein